MPKVSKKMFDKRWADIQSKYIIIRNNKSELWLKRIKDMLIMYNINNIKCVLIFLNYFFENCLTKKVGIFLNKTKRYWIVI